MKKLNCASQVDIFHFKGALNLYVTHAAALGVTINGSKTNILYQNPLNLYLVFPQYCPI